MKQRKPLRLFLPLLSLIILLAVLACTGGVDESWHREVNEPAQTIMAQTATAKAPAATAGAEGSAPESGVPLMQAQNITSGNRFTNPGFEGNTRPVIFGEVNVFDGWEPFYCDKPYTPALCPAERQGSGNPFGLYMGRPEYKLTTVDNRVRSGNSAQQWFCFWRTCRAGVYQIIPTAAGETCTVSAWVQTWSADGTGVTSDTGTKDARDNSTWLIKVDPRGGTYAFASGLQTSRVFGYSDGHYDNYARITYDFTATGPSTTIYFENLRLWPISNNDSYIDDASVVCSGSGSAATSTPGASPAACSTPVACEPVIVTATPGAPAPTRTPGPATPTQIPGGTAQPSPTPQGSGITPTVEITPIGGNTCTAYPCKVQEYAEYEALVNINVRSSPTAAISGNFLRCCVLGGSKFTVYHLWLTGPSSTNDVWGCIKPDCTEWVALRLKGTPNALPTGEPLG